MTFMTTPENDEPQSVFHIFNLLFRSNALCKVCGANFKINHPNLKHKQNVSLKKNRKSDFIKQIILAETVHSCSLSVGQ